MLQQRNPSLAFQCFTSIGTSTYVTEDLVNLWLSADIKKHVEEMIEMYTSNLNNWLNV